MQAIGRPNTFAIVFAVLCWSVVSSYSFGGASECDSKKRVKVKGSEVLIGDSEYRRTRDILLRNLLVEAVTRVNGMEILTRTSNRLLVENDDLTLSTAAYDSVKSRGLVLSYSFPMDGESVTQGSLGTMLNMEVDVVVCDHSGKEAPIYIVVDEIEFKNFEDYAGEDLNAVVASALPSESNLVLVGNDDTTKYHDLVITGKILSVAVTVEEDRFMKALGQTVRASGQPIVDAQYYRLSAIIAMKAYDLVEDTYTVVHETIDERVSGARHEGALARRIDEFVASSLRETSRRLFKKVTAEN